MYSENTFIIYLPVSVFLLEKEDILKNVQTAETFHEISSRNAFHPHTGFT